MTAKSTTQLQRPNGDSHNNNPQPKWCHTTQIGAMVFMHAATPTRCGGATPAQRGAGRAAISFFSSPVASHAMFVGYLVLQTGESPPPCCGPHSWSHFGLFLRLRLGRHVLRRRRSDIDDATRDAASRHHTTTNYQLASRIALICAQLTPATQPPGGPHKRLKSSTGNASQGTFSHR